MARNATVALTPSQAEVVANLYPRLMVRATMGDEATLTYVKRDGTEGEATGTVVAVGGDVNMSNVHVKVETERGPRTINVWSITSMV